MNSIKILEPQTPFRPIHFAALLSNGETHVYVWRNLDYAVDALKELVPDLWPFLTSEHVLGLASPEWDEEYYGSRFSHDEFAALWFAQTVYDSNLVFPDQLEDLYNAEGAAKHVTRLMQTASPKRTETTPLSQWQLFVKSMVTGSTKAESNIARQKKIRQVVPTIRAKLCKNCGVPPMVEEFRHTPPNWMVHCPSCGISTDPREGIDRDTALEAWNQWN